MKLKLAVGAVLRALRGKGSRTQESLMDASSRTYLTGIEQGKSNITLEKLELISEALGVSPLTFLALALSTSKASSTDELILKTQAELEAFKAAGGLDELYAQLEDGALVSRRPGKQIDLQRLENVQRCKADGLSQKQTSEKLGISKQMVNKLWKRELL